ncbi:MAG: asparagine synthase (glutamine-hydrolyzing) [Chloroflexi bacterium]|nr:asparagine synthase (glutamine-hydrolyzing) [Chloroflexota bacterium]
MCGLAGILSLSPSNPPIDETLLDRMREIIAHRGPDDAGSYCSPDGRMGLASRRLSIIDLSPAGHMPMSSDDGSLWIVYNGEVYNFAEHRPMLEARGHTFRSRSDTEVILRLYQEFGPDCVHYLRGMFAIAIWDARQRELFLARDRLGVKPLYYTFAGGQFLFGSEIKSLLLHPAVKRKVDDEAFYHFLTFLTTPPPRTLFKDIFKLPAGHRATIGEDGQLRVEEYWDVFDNARVEPGLSEDEHAARLVAKLRESVKLRMVSDVPFGVLLSGGIDSSTNTALMAELMDRPVQTFSIGYHDHESYNEFQYARRVAEHFRTDHHETLIGARDFIEFLPKLIYHQDEPIADPVCVPVYFVSKLARDNGTIVLQVGEGSDELFGGYAHWMAALKLRRGAWQAYGALPAPIRRAALAAAAPMRDNLRYEYLRRGTAGEELFWGGAIAFGEERKRRLLSDAASRRTAGLTSHDVIRPYRARFDERSPITDYLHWMSYLDLRFRLPELLLMRVDKMTMATSVEARLPFLDHEFVGLAMSIPQKVKLDGGHPKHLLKRAVRGVIPDEIIDRPKQGFRVPVEEWLSESLGAFTRDKLRDFCARTDYFRWDPIERMLARRDDLAWYLLNFALWHERWIEEKELQEMGN